MRARVVVLAVAAAAAAVAGLEPRIYNGEDINISQLPYLVSLQAGSHNCGGTLIAPYWVLTAAHCVALWRDDLGTLPTAVFNSTRQDVLSPGGFTVPAAMLFLHEDYDPSTISNDIGMVRLVSPVSLPTVNPVYRYTASEIASLTAVGTTVFAAGWGLTETGSLATILQKGHDVEVIGNTQCSNDLGIAVDESVMICAGEPTGDYVSCSGDSGGPLFVASDPALQIGIVSWGLENCIGPHVVYVRLSEFGPWVENIMAGQYARLFAVTSSAETEYTFSRASFGQDVPDGAETAITGPLVYATPNEACSAITIPTTSSPPIVLVDRGTCYFVDKVLSAMNAGAVAVLVANNAAGLITMAPPTDTSTDYSAYVPTVMITQDAGTELKAALAAGDVDVSLGPRADPDPTPTPTPTSVPTPTPTSVPTPTPTPTAFQECSASSLSLRAWVNANPSAQVPAAELCL